MYIKLYESSEYDAMYSNEDLVEKLGEVDIYDEKTKSYIKMKPGELIKVASDALYKMHRDYPYLYQFLVKCKLMYIPVFPSEITDTMAVDEYNNLWINLSFLYNDCKMNSDRAFGILFHEMFHIFFDHCMRFNKKYPQDLFAGMDGVYKKENMKSNLCMDYEVNASMVDDGIVTPDFFKVMNGLYKKEYTGMTWEEIKDKYGDKEYNEWLSRNGFSLDDVELKVLEAIEKASEVLLDPDAEDEEKRAARKELQKTLDKILGKSDSGEKTLQDMFEDLQNSKLGDISSIAMEIDDVIDDLYKNPAGMNADELQKTLNDIDRLMDDISSNAEDIAGQFDKTMNGVQSDAENARKSIKDAMKKINEGNLSKDEKQDLLDKAKDSLEDIISDDVEKEKLKKKREERDAKKAEERKEKFKKSHPIRSIIIVMKNLSDLIEFKLISEKTEGIIGKCIDELEPLTELHFSEMKKSNFKELSKALDELKESFLPDLVELINNETILNKTEDDMQRLLDGVFEYVFNAFRTALNNDLDEDARGSVMKTAAQKLRIIGKVLKTQKKWMVGNDFKVGYKDEMKRLMDIFKKDGAKGLFKELWDKGVLEPIFLDKNAVKIHDELVDSGDIKDMKIGDLNIGDAVNLGDGEDVGKAIERIKDAVKNGLRYSDGLDEIEPYEDVIYYNLWHSDSMGPDDNGSTVIELSDNPQYLPDDWDTYAPLAKRFEEDFPEYRIEEEMEAVFSVYYIKTFDKVDIDELREKLENKSNYEYGDWESED